jgi:hypothetical protein
MHWALISTVRLSATSASVTFEVLLASFGLETPALQRLGVLVHFLDVGGVQPARRRDRAPSPGCGRVSPTTTNS